MAQLIERGILEGMHTIVEAGTGVGKSLAYLVPALRSGKKVVVSTGTIALQEQLVRKDIPLVREALWAIRVRVELLKGRNHYLCRRSTSACAPSGWSRRRARWSAVGVGGAHGDRRPRRARRSCRRRRLGTARRRRRRLRRRVLRALSRLLFLQATRCRELRRHRRRQPRAVLPRPRDGRRALAALRRRRPRRSAPVRALGDRCADRDALAGDASARMMRKLHRTYELPAAFDAEIDEGDAPARIGARARSGRTLSACAPTKRRCRPLERLREALYRPRELAARQLARGAAKPTGERRRSRAPARPRAARASLAHRDGRSIAPQACRADEAIAWVERGDGDGRYEVNARRSTSRSFLRATLFARTQSVVSPARRSRATVLRVLCANARRRRRARAGRAVAVRLRAPSAAVRRARRSSTRSRRISRAARRRSIEECLDRTRGRAFVLFTSYARLREVYALLARAARLSGAPAGRMPRARCSIGSAGRPTPCCSRRRRSGKASTSSATRSRA